MVSSPPSSSTPDALDDLAGRLAELDVGGEDGPSAAGKDEDADSLPDDAEAAVRRVLLLVDFNEFLVFKDKDGDCRGSPLPHFNGGTRLGAAPFYIRPGAVELVTRLAHDPRCDLALYTSMRMHNIIPVLRAFDSVRLAVPFTPFNCCGATISAPSELGTGAGGAALWAVFDQTCNARDPRPGKPYAFKRDLHRVWGTREAAAAGYHAENTLLLECDPVKSRDAAGSTIRPVPFTAACVRRCAIDGGAGEAETMRALHRKLGTILARMQCPGAAVPEILMTIDSDARVLKLPSRVSHQRRPPRECVVCLDSLSDAMFHPCRHHCCCTQCAASFHGEPCPLCRVPVEAVDECSPSVSTYCRTASAAKTT